MPSNYYLISKTRTSFLEYNGNAIRLSKTLPYSVDEIIVGKQNNPNFKRAITIFRDSSGKPIEKSFDFSNRLIRNRIYTYSDNTIGDNEFVSTTEIQQFSLQRRALNTYQKLKEMLQSLHIEDTFWKKEKFQANHLSENIETGNKILSIVKIDNMKQPTKEKHSFVEYPEIVNNKITQGSKKFLQFVVNSITGTVDKKTISLSKGLKKPTKDSFLVYRALSINEAKEPLTNHFLRSKNLDKTGIQVLPNYTPEDLNDNLVAIYYNKKIHFNRFHRIPSKIQLVKVARHEVEHAWHDLLLAVGYNTTLPKSTKTSQQVDLTSPAVQKEINSCTKAIKKYISYDDNYAQYKENYIEKSANKEANKAVQKYKKEGEVLHNNFKHIPTEYL